MNKDHAFDALPRSHLKSEYKKVFQCRAFETESEES
jgi:hypothetical protein